MLSLVLNSAALISSLSLKADTEGNIFLTMASKSSSRLSCLLLPHGVLHEGHSFLPKRRHWLMQSEQNLV
jgi:hypothetical protein